VQRVWRALASFVSPDLHPVASPDPSDTKFLYCVLAAEPDFIVTGNRQDFPASRYGITHVVNAAELLDLITIGL
jgi:predicted nucleic acid-binding protein